LAQMLARRWELESESKEKETKTLKNKIKCWYAFCRLQERWDSSQKIIERKLLKVLKCSNTYHSR
jgi:hypothetical protein